MNEGRASSDELRMVRVGRCSSGGGLNIKEKAGLGTLMSRYGSLKLTMGGTSDITLQITTSPALCPLAWRRRGARASGSGGAGKGIGIYIDAKIC